MMCIKATGSILIAAILIASACDQKPTAEGVRDKAAETGLPSDLAIRGCENVIPELRKSSPPGWRGQAIVVGNFGFYGMAGDFYGHRPHEGADIQVKLPIVIEGHSDFVLWLPQDERNRASFILPDVPRRGSGNSYRVEDGHRAIRFEPCSDREWNAWTTGLALADRGETTLLVKEAAASQVTPVILGPWDVQTTYR
jgi:hypothetical protein